MTINPVTVVENDVTTTTVQLPVGELVIVHDNSVDPATITRTLAGDTITEDELQALALEYRPW